MADQQALCIMRMQQWRRIRSVFFGSFVRLFVKSLMKGNSIAIVVVAKASGGQIIGIGIDVRAFGLEFDLGFAVEIHSPWHQCWHWHSHWHISANNTAQGKRPCALGSLRFR